MEVYNSQYEIATVNETDISVNNNKKKSLCQTERSKETFYSVIHKEKINESDYLAVHESQIHELQMNVKFVNLNS